MTNYQSKIIPKLYLDEFIKLLKFIGENYDWKNHQHLVYIKKIGSVELTDTYKGGKGDLHQIFKNIELKPMTGIPAEKKQELKRILKA